MSLAHRRPSWSPHVRLLAAALVLAAAAPGLSSDVAGATAPPALPPAATPPSTPEPTPAAPGPGPTPGDGDDDDPSLYEGWATPQAPVDATPRAEPITLLLDYGAYYTSAGLYLPLTSTPTPDAGERSEAQIYWSLLRGALVPRFLVLEASVNPMPCLGLLLRQWDWAYERAQVTPDLNLARALTAGFDEPFALSLFIGNVMSYDVKGRPEERGRGYLGAVVSGGLGHIKDNLLVEDRWLEAELKLKGNRISEEVKLAWSFRAGVKLHDNPWITDTAFLALRRSRVDYQDDSWLLANSGVEYRFDMSLHGEPLRHFFLVDKKWPLGRGKVALVMGVGVLWESTGAYTGVLADQASHGLQLLLRPNVVW